MKARPYFPVFVFLLFAFLSACSGSAASVLDHAGFVAALEERGSQVEDLGEIEQPFFPVAGHRISIDGLEVQVFEFADEAAAAEAAGTISPDGSGIGTSMVSWIEPPHFYQSGRLIVLYVGGELKMTSLLETLLGAQIAGGS